MDSIQTLAYSPPPALPHRLPIDGKVLAFLFAPAAFLAGMFYGVGIQELAIGIAGVALVLGTFVAPEVGLYFYLLIQPFDQLLLGTEEQILTPGKILGPFILLAYLLHPSRVRTPILISRGFIVAMLAFSAWGLVTAIWAPAPLAVLRYVAQMTVQVLLVVLAIHRLSDRVRLSRALVATVLGGAAGSAAMVLGLGQETATGRQSLGEFTNPNTTALALSLSAACIPAAWACTRSRLIRWGLVAAGPIVLAGMLMTGSRSAFVAIAVAAPIALVVAGRAGALQRLLIPVGTALVVILTVQFVFSSELLAERSLERLTSVLEGEAGQETRLGIWRAAFQSFLTRPWGFGYGNTAFALEMTQGFFIDIHSSFMSAVVDGGVVSLLTFSYALWAVFRNVRGMRRGDLGVPAMILLVFLGVSMLTHTIHYSKYFWIPLTLCIVLAEQSRREELAAAAHATPVAAADARQSVLGRLGAADAVVYP